MNWIFLPLDGSVNRDNFDCGNSELNEYLKKYARQNHRKGIATTFIAIPEAENRNVVGYYSVSFAFYSYENNLGCFGIGDRSCSSSGGDRLCYNN